MSNIKTRMKNVVIITIAIVTLLSCKNSKSTTVATTHTNPEMNDNPRVDLPDSMYRVIVSFISSGEGTDGKAMEKLNQIIEQHQKDFGMPVAKEEIPWGREGEMDICFKLLGQDKKAKDTFVRNLQEAFKGNQLVFIEENSVAKHKPRPKFGGE